MSNLVSKVPWKLRHIFPSEVTYAYVVSLFPSCNFTHTFNFSEPIKQLLSQFFIAQLTHLLSIRQTLVH